jgi:hypothetical protein
MQTEGQVDMLKPAHLFITALRTKLESEKTRQYGKQE